MREGGGGGGGVVSVFVSVFAFVSFSVSASFSVSVSITTSMQPPHPHPHPTQAHKPTRPHPLVPIVAGAVARVNLDLQRRREVGRDAPVLLLLSHSSLPRALLLAVSRDAQVADAVRGGAGDDVASAASGLHVSDPPPRPRLRPGKGRDTSGKVVSLRSERREHLHLPRAERAGLPRHRRLQHGHLGPADGGGVVAERDDAVLSAGTGGAATVAQRALDALEEGGFHLLAVDDHLAAEEPVARVLRVALRHVKALDVGGVACGGAGREG